MNKQKIIDQLKAQIAAKLNQAAAALNTTKGHATESELKAEGKYDTRSIEAGYLAGAQQLRVEELEQEMALIDEIDIHLSNREVCVGSVVEIELNKIKRLHFISSTAGGSLLNIDGTPVLVISAFSPIGAQAIGLSVGDTFEVETASETREYLIKAIS